MILDAHGNPIRRTMGFGSQFVRERDTTRGEIYASAVGYIYVAITEDESEEALAVKSAEASAEQKPIVPCA